MKRLRLTSDPWYELPIQSKMCCPPCSAFCGFCAAPIFGSHVVTYVGFAALCPDCSAAWHRRMKAAFAETLRLGRVEGNALALGRVRLPGSGDPIRVQPGAP